MKFFLLFLSEASHKQVQSLLQLSSKSQMLGLREVAANLLQGNIPVVTVTGKHGSNYRLSLSCNRKKSKKLNLTNLFSD